MVNLQELSLLSLETVTATELNYGPVIFVADELQNAAINNTEDAQTLTGKGGRTIGNLKRNKGVTVSATSGMVVLGALETQTGSEWKTLSSTDTGSAFVTEFITASTDSADGSLTLTGTPLTTSGITVYKLTDGIITESYEYTSGGETNTLTVSAKKLTLTDATIKKGDEFAVYYTRSISSGYNLDNLTDTYSDKVSLYIDCLAEDKCHKQYRVQFFIPVADFSGTFDLSFGENQTTHGFEATSLPSCGLNQKLWSVIVFGDDDGKAATDNDATQG